MTTEFSFKDLLRVLKKRWILLICGLVLGGLIAGLWSMFMIPKMYTSSVQMYVTTYTNQPGETPDDNASLNYELLFGPKLASSCSAILKSNSALELVSNQLNGKASIGTIAASLSISADENSQILSISSTTRDPQLSADICNALVAITPQTLQEFLRAGTIKPLGEAVPISVPSSPDVKKNAAIGALAGFIVALLLVLILGLTDTTIKSADDLKQRMQISVLAELPSSAGRKGQ